MAANDRDNPLIKLADKHYPVNDPNRKDNYYFTFYHEVFESLINKEINLLELGVAGGYSLMIWMDYFKHANIVGLDQNPPTSAVTDLIKTKRIKYLQGDQGDESILRAAIDATSGKGFDIIIDDAAHIGSLAKKSFSYLFNHGLNRGGLYFIEDFGTGYFSNWADSHEFCEPVNTSSPGQVQKLFESHQYGMVGFIKQLIDELHSDDIRVTEKRRFDMEYIKIIPHVAMIAKSI